MGLGGQVWAHHGSGSAACSFTALHITSDHGHMEALKALLEKGADVNAKRNGNEYGFLKRVCGGHGPSRGKGEWWSFVGLLKSENRIAARRRSILPRISVPTSLQWRCGRFPAPPAQA